MFEMEETIKVLISVRRLHWLGIRNVATFLGWPITLISDAETVVEKLSPLLQGRRSPSVDGVLPSHTDACLEYY